MWGWLHRSRTPDDSIFVKQDQIGQHYYPLLFLSAFIASLAILAQTEAVELGAMLLSPLMTSLSLTGVGVTEGKGKQILQGLTHLSLSMIVVVLVAFVTGVVVPFGRLPEDALLRAQPTVLHLFIALAAGAIGVYGTLKKEVSSDLAGVAAAIVLQIPLVIVGLTLAKGMWPAALGASTHFVSNAVAMVASATLVLLLMGKRPEKGAHKRVAVLAGVTVAGLFAVLAALLGQHYWQITEEQMFASRSRAVVEDMLEPVEGRVRDLKVSEDDGRYLVRLELEVPEGKSEPSVQDVSQKLREVSGRPLKLEMTTEYSRHHTLP